MIYITECLPMNSQPPLRAVRAFIGAGFGSAWGLAALAVSALLETRSPGALSEAENALIILRVMRELAWPCAGGGALGGVFLALLPDIAAWRRTLPAAR